MVPEDGGSLILSVGGVIVDIVAELETSAGVGVDHCDSGMLACLPGNPPVP